MIKVEKLTKHYGATVAVDDVSFEVARGQVVGFLGPNGAGKTTTMRIITGSLGATEGVALLDGKNVFENARECKRRIGYLPEVAPLYGDMRVRDYVVFAAKLKGVEDTATATERVIQRVGLEPVSHRIIEHLSKGYRQRVGLAQALVHDPDVLILDEPYSGLDPAQRVEIRDLLKSMLADDRTIILSTHVLADIEALCERVVIINRGRVIAQDSIERLSGDAHTIELLVARPDETLGGELGGLDGVNKVEELGEGRYRLLTSGEDLRETVASTAVSRGLLELSGRQRLEDIYLRLTAGAEA